MKRNVIKVSASHEMLKQLFTQDRVTMTKTINGLPEDAVFAGAGMDVETQSVYFFFQHSSFPVVIEGGAIVTQRIEVEDMTDEEIMEHLVWRQ